MLPDTDVWYACPTCKSIYEFLHHHVRPPTEPRCEVCQQTLPIADGDDWLTYRRIRSRDPRPKAEIGIKPRSVCFDPKIRQNRAWSLDGKTLLKPGLDSAEQPEPHLVVIACERDHETHPAMA